MPRVALVRDKIDARTFKIRSALRDSGTEAVEYYRLDPYHPFFSGYDSSNESRQYSFYYDGWKKEFLLRHLGLPNVVPYLQLSRRLSSEGFDILHCNSVTEHLAAGLIRWGKKPVVTEVYDVTSLYETNNIKMTFSRGGQRPLTGFRGLVLNHVLNNALRWERISHETSAGLVYTSAEMLNYVESLYDIRCPSVVIPNAVYGKLLPALPRPPRASDHAGGIHLVYIGVLRDSGVGHHRDICDQLNRIATGEVTVHLYPVVSEGERAAIQSKLTPNRNIIWHEPLPYDALYRELPTYDGGLVLLAPYDEALLDVALPNKIFEYAAAGIPVLVSPYRPLINFIQRYDCGEVLHDLSSVASFRFRPVHFRSEFTIEHYIPRLIRLYETIAR